MIDSVDGRAFLANVRVVGKQIRGQGDQPRARVGSKRFRSRAAKWLGKGGDFDAVRGVARSSWFVRVNALHACGVGSRKVKSGKGDVVAALAERGEEGCLRRRGFRGDGHMMRIKRVERDQGRGATS